MHVIVDNDKMHYNIDAKAAYEALMNTSTDSDEETSNSDNDEGSNKSVSS